MKFSIFAHVYCKSAILRFWPCLRHHYDVVRWTCVLILVCMERRDLYLSHTMVSIRCIWVFTFQVHRGGITEKKSLGKAKVKVIMLMGLVVIDLFYCFVLYFTCFPYFLAYWVVKFGRFWLHIIISVRYAKSKFVSEKCEGFILHVI